MNSGLWHFLNHNFSIKIPNKFYKYSFLCKFPTSIKLNSNIILLEFHHLHPIATSIFWTSNPFLCLYVMLKIGHLANLTWQCQTGIGTFSYQWNGYSFLIVAAIIWSWQREVVWWAGDKTFLPPFTIVFDNHLNAVCFI